jgi:precorrin-6Y C5,15-methyltransferase (decarboxylating)
MEPRSLAVPLQDSPFLRGGKGLPLALGVVRVVGITDRGADSLSVEARGLVDQAQVLCGGERHLAFFPDHSAERFVIRANVDELVERLRAEERMTVVLASGDPGCFGIGPLLAARLGAERVAIVPNASSPQLAFSRLGIASQDATILSAHGRPLDSILPAALLAEKVAILTDARNTPAAIAQALLDAGDDASTQAHVFERLGSEAERHLAAALPDLVEQSFAPLNLLVLLRQRPRPWPIGRPDAAFAHRGGMITKAEVRAVSIAKLCLHERAVVWDVGAGCGSVAIEASGLARRGQVYAVECDPTQLDYLHENRRRFGAGNVQVIAGEAPEALRDLPAPDAVFVGGSGGYLRAILVAAMGRLQPSGSIVANFASVEHLTEALTFARGCGWSTEVTQLAVSRGAAIAGATRFAALNPVFVACFVEGGEG